MLKNLPFAHSNAAFSLAKGRKWLAHIGRSCGKVAPVSGDSGSLGSFECSLLLLVNQSALLPFEVSKVPAWVSFKCLHTRSR